MCHPSAGILAIGVINDAIDAGIVDETLKALQRPTAKLSSVQPEHAFHYQTLLSKIKKAKAQVLLLLQKEKG